jgi:hypothetical protein
VDALGECDDSGGVPLSQSRSECQVVVPYHDPKDQEIIDSITGGPLSQSGITNHTLTFIRLTDHSPIQPRLRLTQDKEMQYETLISRPLIEWSAEAATESF